MQPRDRKFIDYVVLGLREALHCFFGFGSCCRFDPCCSRYARSAVRRHGALKGGWLAMKRLGRCHPWGGSGFDPVPGMKETRLLIRGH